MSVLGIRVVHDPRMPGMAEARGMLWWKHIAVGNAFQFLPERVQQAMLFHEAAHCRELHMEKRALLLPLLFLTPGFVARVAREQEFVADRFAARHGFGHDLSQFLIWNASPETMFYPSCEERARKLMEVCDAEATS